MTYAPETLKAARRLLLAHLDIHENNSAYPTDLDPEEVGIVGDPNHLGGYHCGRDRVDDDDYSVRESSRDRNGLTEAASALDIGQWSARVAGKSHDLRSMSMWIVAQCKAGVPDSRDIREVIYSPDGTTVKRWDRLGRRSSGDSSHRWHTHISYHRDATKAGRDQTALFRRYLTTIGLLAGEDDDMQLTDRVDLVQAADVQYSSPTTTVEGVLASTNYYVLQTRNRVLAETAALRTQVTAQTATIEALAEAIRAGGGSVDVAAIRAHIDQRVAQAEAEIRDAVADLGEGGAERVRADESRAGE